MSLPTKQLNYTAAEINALLAKIEDGQNVRKERRVLLYARTSNVITFKDKNGNASPFAAGSGLGIPAVRLYDSSNNPVHGYTIFDLTVNGFKITVSDECFIDYAVFETNEGTPE